MQNIVIREAVESDCKAVIALIKDLAVYEKLENHVTMTEEVLKRDGFGEHRFFYAMVAEDKNSPAAGQQLIGLALYFYMYSTFEGRSAHIEDLFVSEKYRGRGIGTHLLTAVVKRVREVECKRLDLHCQNWNTPSIGFYKNLGAVDITERDGFHLFRFKQEILDKIVSI